MRTHIDSTRDRLEEAALQLALARRDEDRAPEAVERALALLEQHAAELLHLHEQEVPWSPPSFDTLIASTPR